jgi:sialidase-1
LAELEKENDELKAKVAELEKVKPAAKPKATDKPDETK